jgi:hypothetical protein
MPEDASGIQASTRKSGPMVQSGAFPDLEILEVLSPSMGSKRYCKSKLTMELLVAHFKMRLCQRVNSQSPKLWRWGHVYKAQRLAAIIGTAFTSPELQQ